MTLLVTLGVSMQAVAQKSQQTTSQELVDTTSQDAVVAFSDTTSVDSTASHVQVDLDTDDLKELDNLTLSKIIKVAFHDSNADRMMEFIFVLLVVFLIFVLAPLLIIIALFYFINKNRKDRLKLAQMAMQQGQPIPDQLLKNNVAENVGDEYQKGMRQCFVGVGLMVFLGYAAGEVGFGIGALVFCIGLGKVFAAKTVQKRNNEITSNDLNSNL